MKHCLIAFMLYVYSGRIDIFVSSFTYVKYVYLSSCVFGSMCVCLSVWWRQKKACPPSRCGAPRPAECSSRSSAPLFSPPPPHLQCSPWWCWRRELGGWSVNRSHLVNKLIRVGRWQHENNISIELWVMLIGELCNVLWLEGVGLGEWFWFR